MVVGFSQKLGFGVCSCEEFHSGFSVGLASGEWFVEFWDFIKSRGVRGEVD